MADNAYYISNAYLPCCAGGGAPAPFKLATPGVSSTGVTATGFTVDWADIPNATSYTGQVATDAGFNNIVDTQSGLTSSQFTTAGRMAGTAYFYRVQALDSTGTYLASDYGTGSVTTAAGLTAPTLSAQRSAITALLLFNNPTGGTDIVIEQSGNGTTWNPLSTVGFGQMSYEKTGLTAGSNSFYRAKTRDANTGTDSDYSTPVQVTTFNRRLSVGGTVVDNDLTLSGAAGLSLHFNTIANPVSPDNSVNRFLFAGINRGNAAFQNDHVGQEFAIEYPNGTIFYGPSTTQQYTFVNGQPANITIN